MRYFILFFICLLSPSCTNFIGNPHPVRLASRTVSVTAKNIKIEPPNWWTDIALDTLELMIQMPNIVDFTVTMRPYKGLRVVEVQKGDSPNYVFVRLSVSASLERGHVFFDVKNALEGHIIDYPIYRRSRKTKAQGITASDAIYLVYPDRFVNGDSLNDRVEGFYEGLDMDNPDGRHGGDLQGIINQLAYIKELGCTAIWLNPELENNQTATSYHGYASTDLYRVDARLGSNDLYWILVDSAHRSGLKIIRDMVPNHIGDQHPWMEDLPQKNWLNYWREGYVQTNFKSTPNSDPYAAQADKKRFNQGWFDRRMPDLNQKNPQVARYLLQQAIWWIEYAAIDAFRIDTYAYADPEFMTWFCSKLRVLYPNISLIGEIWEESVQEQGFYTDNQFDTKASKLTGIIDFQLNKAILEALTKPTTWTEGAAKIYHTLAQDAIYNDPFQNMIMLDNHDMSRYFSVIEEDFDKWKKGIVLLLTLRGIPQIYYGTERLSTGLKSEGDGALRKDFLSIQNDLSGEGVAALQQQQDAYTFLKKMLHFRKKTAALQSGKLMQYWIEDGVYVYFRYTGEECVMVAWNTEKKAKKVDMKRFEERIGGYSKAFDVLSEKEILDISALNMQEHELRLLHFKK